MDDRSNPNPMFRDADPEFVHRAVCYLEGQQSVAEFAEFAAELAADAEKRGLFVQLCRTRAGLIEALKQADDPDGSPIRSPDRAAKDETGAMFIRPSAGESASALSPASSPPEIRRPNPRRRLLGQRDWKVRLMAAAILILATSMAWMIFGPRSPQVANRPDSPAPPGDGSAAVAPVVLQSGFTRRTLDNGVDLLIEGPAEYEILGGSRLRLNSGRLTAVVPHAAIGFTVETKEARITDLGTEFGVIAGNGFTETEVFDGRVAVEPQSVAAVRQVLSIRQANRVDSGGRMESAEADPALFVRVGDYDAHNARDAAAASFERWSAFSQELRRDPSLVLYYTLDDVPANAPVTTYRLLPNHAAATAGQYDNSLDAFHTPAVGEGRWPGHGAALEFDPSRQQRLLLEHYPSALDGQLTVFAWVYARSRPMEWGNIADNWGTTKLGQFHLSLWPKDGDLTAKAQQADGTQSVAREGKPFPIGCWCQVAFVVDGEMLRLYRDGLQIAATPCRGLVLQPSVPNMGIGFKPGNDGYAPAAGNDRGFWDGKIDELAVFHRALSAAEIKNIYEAGRVSP